MTTETKIPVIALTSDDIDRAFFALGSISGWAFKAVCQVEADKQTLLDAMTSVRAALVSLDNLMKGNLKLDHENNNSQKVENEEL